MTTEDNIDQLITSSVLNKKLVRFLKQLKEQGTKLNEDSIKEVEKEFWKLIKPALGENNWEGNIYKGSLNTEKVNEIIDKYIQKVFKKKNFDEDGNFIGGWNEELDTKNIKKVIGEKNFVNGELSIPAGWDKDKDLQNLKDNKPYLSEVVKDNLGDFKKEVDTKFEQSKQELKTKLDEADAKLAQGEQKLTETANTIKKDVEDKSTALKSEVDAKLTKADQDIQTKLGEVDTKLNESKADIQKKLKEADTKLEQTDKKVEAKLEVVDVKLAQTEQKIKDEVIPIVKGKLGEFEDESYRPAPNEKYLTWKEVIAVIHTVFGTEYFYKKGEEGIPAERIGFYRKKEELAQIAHDAEQHIKDLEKWNNFYLKHRIEKVNQLKWPEKYSAPELAEGAYEDAVVEAEQKLAGDSLKQGEISTINKAQTPDKLKEIVEDIPRQRKLMAWEVFFSSYDNQGHIQDAWKDNWRNSQLSPKLAEDMYQNGWYNSPNARIGDNRLIETYETEEIINDVKYDIQTKNVNPLVHVEPELKKVHRFIAKRIEAETNLDKFPDVIGNDLSGELTTIQGAYEENKVPDTREYEKIRILRDNKIKELFKKYFLGDKPEQFSSWEDKHFESWRSAKTGLANDGKTQRIAVDNSWVQPNEIIGGKTEYQGVKNIDVLKYKKSDVENEINIVNDLIDKINKFTKLRQLDQTAEEHDILIKHLNLDLLPAGSKEKVEQAITDARAKLDYYLGDTEDGGIEETRLLQIEQSIKEKQPQRIYAPLTAEILTNFINASKGMEIKFKTDQGEAGDINSLLKDKGAYRFEDTEKGKEVVQNEDNLDLEMRGQYLIPFSYKKASEGTDFVFNPDTLSNPTNFCQARMELTTSFFGGEKYKPVIVGNQGHLPFATGIGKTTKVVNCLVRGGEWDEINKKPGWNVILVMPTQALVEAAYGHHNSETGWLQNWGCVKCQDWIRNAKVKRGTYKLITEQEISDGVEWETKDIFRSHGKYEVVKNDILPVGKRGLSIITGDELIGFINRDLLLRNKKYVAVKSGKKYQDNSNPKRPVMVDEYVAKEVDMDTPSPLNTLQPDNDPNWFSTKEDIDNWINSLKEKIINKETDIIDFDEGHFTIPSYQALQKWVVAVGYRTNRMSATFPGQPFSITSTYQRDNLFVGKSLNPNWNVGEWNGKPNTTLNEFLATAKIWFFLPNLDLVPEQTRALGKVCWIAYTPEWDPYIEPVSYGMPKSSISFVDPDKSVGMNPDAGGVFLGGKLIVKTLQEKFGYKKKNVNLTQADGVQMIGRVGRSYKGKAFLLSTKWEELDISKDVSAAMVESAFDGEVKHMGKMGYDLIQDAQMLRLALALNKKFGKPLEEILIGLNVIEKDEKERVKAGKSLTKITWRTDKEKPSYKLGSVDDGLWNDYLGNKQKPKMDKEVAKDRLLECISTYISEAEGFPKKINVWRQSSLVEFIWGDDIRSGKKQPIITEIRKVLNGVIEKGIDSYNSKGYDKINKTAKDRKVIEDVAHYYKVADANIDMSYQWNKERTQQLLTLIIEKN